ncbi:MAG: response regulator [Gemmataceae bacterium]|nr:response regulator [Gemmataceae bacterium]
MAEAPTILVLDDAADTRALIETCLRSQGYRVLSASDGVTGVELAERHRPDLVLTDMLMPGMSGFRVIDRLRNEPDYHPRIIMMSGIDAPLQRAYAQALGADDYIIKPFVLKQLIDSVRQLCPMTSAADRGLDGKFVRA